MEVKCCHCDIVLKEKYIRIGRPKFSRCRRCHIKWLEGVIKSMQYDIYMTQTHLKEYLSKNDVSDDEYSNNDDDDDYPIDDDGDSLKGAKRVDSDDDNYLDNNTN